MTPTVADVYNRYPAEAQTLLKKFRSIIFDTAAENARIGPITETLKWGEPAYLTEATKSGTTIRLAWSAKQADICKLLVNCKSTLVADWKDIYSPTLNFEGNRAIIFEINKPIPMDAIKHCISMALTYHLDKKITS